MPSRTLKPGQKAPRSGQYEIVGSRGGRTGIERTVTNSAHGWVERKVLENLGASCLDLFSGSEW